MSAGDLILFEVADNPVSEMIRYYDRSEYTHIGIDVGDGTVVNCRTEGGLFLAGEDGGVRVDELETLTRAGRLWRRAPVTLDEGTRKAAVTKATDWAEPDGLGSVSGFSFFKMFQCAVAVSATRPRVFDDEAREAMVDAAVTAADAWRYDPARGGRDEDRPASFFCAEMVLEAYSGALEVPRDFLAPPDDPDPADDTTRLGAGDLAQDLIDSWREGGRSRTMTALLLAVGKHDPEFFGGALVNVIRWAAEKKEPAEVPRGSGNTEILPPGLVTPRMLLRADWAVGPVGGPYGTDATA